MKYVWLCLLGLGLMDCSEADTLADEPPVEVVIEGMPSWQNGVGALVQLKCGYCHAVPRPDIAPNNTPLDLDLNHYATRLVEGQVVRGGDSLGRWLFDGILDQAVTVYDDTSMPRQMPLNYGTPLTNREKTAMLLWSNLGAAHGDEGPPAAGDFEQGARLYFESGCVDCHDNRGGGAALNEDLYLGPPIRRQAVTLAKIKSMWLHRIAPDPLSDQDAAHIRTYLLDVLPQED